MPRSLELDRKVARVVAALQEGKPRTMARKALIKRIGRRGLEGAVREGTLVALLPAVYVATALENDHSVRCAAVRRWSGWRVLISGESALHLFNAAYPAPARIRCVAVRTWNARTPSWVHLSRSVLPEDKEEARDDWCVGRGEAVVDAWACAPRKRRKDVLYRALWLEIATPDKVIEAGARRSRLPDRSIFNGIMGEFVAGATSPTEVMAKREVFTGPEFADLEWQVLMVVQGRDRTPDAIHRAARIDLECDGDADHTSPEDVARDRERNTEFASIGWLPVRFSFKELRDRPEWCRRMLAETIAARLAAPAIPSPDTPVLDASR